MVEPFRRDFSNQRFADTGSVFERCNRHVVNALPVTEIRDYTQLRAALNRRRVELGLTMAEFDAAGGLSDGHAAKLLLTPDNPKSWNRNIGPVSLPLLLGALKLRLRLEPIED